MIIYLYKYYKYPLRIVLPPFFTARDWTSRKPRNCTVISSLRNLGKNWVMMQGQFLRPLNRPTNVLPFPCTPPTPKNSPNWPSGVKMLVKNSCEVGSTLNKSLRIWAIYQKNLPTLKVLLAFLWGIPRFSPPRRRERSFSVRMARPARIWTLVWQKHPTIRSNENMGKILKSTF